MKNLKILLYTVLIFSVNITAQIYYDTVFTRQVGNGVYHSYIEAPSVPWTINVLEIDLNKAGIVMETGTAGDRYDGYEKTSSMSKKLSVEGHRVIGGINGDFYGTGGIPISTFIRKGEVAHENAQYTRTRIAFDNSNKPVLDFFTYSGEVLFDTLSHPVTSVNKMRGTDHLILYNHYNGETTGTNEFGAEVTLDPLDSWLVDEPVRCVVTNKVYMQGNSVITDSTAVLSGHGTARDFINNNMEVGDTVTILNHSNPYTLPAIKEMIGGFPRIIKDGTSVVTEYYALEGGSSTFHSDRHPRTAVGFNQDSTKLYMVTVDGRQTSSAGINLYELADFMMELGCYQAVNLDGGGSTTMVVRDTVVNSPSDASGERTVSNALFVVSVAPRNSLGWLDIQQDTLRIFAAESRELTVIGKDTPHYNNYTVDPEDLSFSMSGSIGSISPQGIFTAGSIPDTGYIYAETEGLRDSICVIVKALDYGTIDPHSAVTDSINTIDFDFTIYDTEGMVFPINESEIDWSVGDSSVGQVDASGLFTPRRSGTTSITAAWGGFSDTGSASVQVGSGKMIVEPFDSENGWIIKGENIDDTTGATSLSYNTSKKTEGDASLEVNYSYTYNQGNTPRLILENLIPLFGMPEDLQYDIDRNSNSVSVILLMKDANDSVFVLPPGNYPAIEGYDTVKSKLSSLFYFGGSLEPVYPVKLYQFYIELPSGNDGSKITGTIYFDNVRVYYNDYYTGIDLAGSGIPEKFNLEQNYPNPFNPSTIIKYNLNKEGRVTLTIYDLLGRRVEMLVDEHKQAGSYQTTWDASSMAAGIYFYSLKQNGNLITRKMMLLK